MSVKMKKVWIILAIMVLIGGIYYLYKNPKDNKNGENNVQNANEIISTSENNTIYDENNAIRSNQYNTINSINNTNSQNNIEDKTETNTSNNDTNSSNNETNTSNNETNEEVKTEQTNSIKEENTAPNNVPEKNASKDTSSPEIKEKLAPSGFMGSSLLRVAIYSNNEVYLLKYDGEGYDDNNIVDKELIATNASSIYSKGKGEDFEAIVVKGKSNMQINSNNYAWIEFEK